MVGFSLDGPFVKKNRTPVSDEYGKSKMFRDRSKDYARKQRLKDEELKHPFAEPYHRVHKDWTKEAMDGYDTNETS